MAAEATEVTRMRSKTKQRLQRAYPNTPLPDLIDLAFYTSPLSADVALSEVISKLTPSQIPKKLAKKKISKRGSAMDILLIVLVVGFMCMMTLIGFTLYTAVNDEIQNNTMMPQTAKDASQALRSSYTGVLNWGVLLVLGGMSIVALGLAALVRVHVAFAALYFCLWIPITLVAAAMSNIYDGLASNALLSAAANELGVITFIATKLPWIVLVVGLLLMVVMYKTRGPQ